MGIYILLCLTTLLNIVLLLNNLHYLDNVISFTNSSLYEWENVNSKVNSIVLTSNVRVYYPGIMAPEYIQWVNDSSILFVTNDGVFIYDALKGRITFIASIPSGVTHSHTRKAFLVKNTIIIVRYDEVYFIKTIPINDTYYPIRMYSKSINPIGVFKDKVLGFKVDTIYVLDLGNDSIYLLTTLDYSIDRVIRYNDSCILVFHITEEGGLVISLINPWVKRIYWSLELSGVKSYAVSLNTRTDTLALVVKDAVWIKKKTLSSIILVEIGSGVVYNKTIDFQKEVGETSSVRCRWINNETLLIGFGNVLYFIYDIREEKLNYIGLWRNVVKLDDNLLVVLLYIQ